MELFTIETNLKINKFLLAIFSKAKQFSFLLHYLTMANDIITYQMDMESKFLFKENMQANLLMDQDKAEVFEQEN